MLVNLKEQVELVEHLLLYLKNHLPTEMINKTHTEVTKKTRKSRTKTINPIIEQDSNQSNPPVDDKQAKITGLEEEIIKLRKQKEDLINELNDLKDRVVKERQESTALIKELTESNKKLYDIIETKVDRIEINQDIIDYIDKQLKETLY